MNMNIELAIHEETVALAKARRAVVELLREVKDPNDQRLIDAETAIDAAGAKIRRLELMREAGKTLASEDAKAALVARRKEAFKTAITLAKGRIELAGKIDKAIDGLGALLNEWQAVGDRCRRAAAEVHGSDTLQSWQYSLLNAASGNNGRFGAALDFVLCKIGLGTTGIPSDTLVMRRPIGNPLNIKDAAEAVADQLEAQLENSLAKFKSEEC